jgi:hypothetical protein
MNRTRAIVTALALLAPAVASAASGIDMYRDPGCPCCSKWAALAMKQLGRNVRTIDEANRAQLQKRLGVPAELSSCHTTIIDGYVFEGHVPIADVKRLLSQRPAGVKGLAVAAMPIGSPGMEVPGRSADRYEVIAFGAAGKRVFARHGS